MGIPNKDFIWLIPIKIIFIIELIIYFLIWFYYFLKSKNLWFGGSNFSFSFFLFIHGALGFSCNVFLEFFWRFLLGVSLFSNLLVALDKCFKNWFLFNFWCRTSFWILEKVVWVYIVGQFLVHFSSFVF